GAFPTLMPAWLTGCRYVLMERYDPESWIETVRTERVTHVIVVPSQLASLLDAPSFAPDALRSLRMVCSLGAPLPREHKERLLRVLPDGALWELYGLTEGFITVLDGADLPAHIDSVGTPLAFSAMRIVGDDGSDLPAGEIGEIVGRGPLLTPGYWGRDDLTAQAITDGWLRTGDLGFVDPDGYLHLVDRQKDMIISGGVNVFPRDIEEVAARHPAVREVAVYGVPDARWGESPVAAIVCHEGACAAAAELREWINARVGARFQRLREVLVVAELPRNIAGKTLKRELRERHPAPAPEPPRA
ncbi:MAG TPA: fatty acid--CoA ligase family protein, partial [Xanthomonadales bacterium]|nr:fatty acid--CoA ligase family protein [Xanthomonadales bacterium]